MLAVIFSTTLTSSFYILIFHFSSLFLLPHQSWLPSHSPNIFLILILPPSPATHLIIPFTPYSFPHPLSSSRTQRLEFKALALSARRWKKHLPLDNFSCQTRVIIIKNPLDLKIFQFFLWYASNNNWDLEWHRCITLNDLKEITKIIEYFGMNASFSGKLKKLIWSTINRWFVRLVAVHFVQMVYDYSWWK